MEPKQLNLEDVPGFPPSPRIVAFTGLAGSGKSEGSKLLTREGWRLVKFADILKSMLRAFYEMCGLDEEEITRRLEGDLKELPDPLLQNQTPRHAMQTLGGEWGRDLIHPELWINAWRSRVRLMTKAGFNVVVDDLRYPNEERAIRDLGGEIYHVHREAHKAVPTHASEGHVCDADEVIENNSTITELHSKIREITAIN